MRYRRHGLKLVPLIVLLLPAALPAHEVPAGAVLDVRLLTTLASYGSEEGDRVEAVLIAPVRAGSEVAVHPGAELHGYVKRARRVGVGVRREAAQLEIELDELWLPEGKVIPVRTQLVRVDMARERVDGKGRIRGTRATNTIMHRIGGYVTRAMSWNPYLGIAPWALRFTLLRFPEPEIYYPPGVELEVRLLEPVRLDRLPAPRPQRRVLTAEEAESLSRYVNAQPFLTRTAKGDKPSDITNVMFVGRREALERAFEAAGWCQARPKKMTTRLRTAHAIAENRGYQEAPMSLLTLEGAAPEMTWQKALNTFAKRHHIRIWPREAGWRGEPVWVGAATEDNGIALSRGNKTFIHTIDENIDDERAKIVNDLQFTGCVDAVRLVERPDVPREARNGTGDRMVTDGRMAVVFLNACLDPRPPIDGRDDGIVPMRGRTPERLARRFVLSIRNEVQRANLFYGVYSLSSYSVRTMLHRRNKETPPPRRVIDADDNVYEVLDAGEGD